MYFQRLTTGEVDGIRKTFISVVYWMYVLVAKRRKTIQVIVKMDTKVKFARFAKIIGLELGNIGVPDVLMMIILITS